MIFEQKCDETKSLALLENTENPQGFLGTGCDTDMVLYSTRILKDKVCATKGCRPQGRSDGHRTVNHAF